VNRRHEKTYIDKIIGRNIVIERKSRNLTRDELAEMMELTTSHMGLIERGERGATAVSLSKLSKILEIPVDHLFSNPKNSGLSIIDTHDATTSASRKKIQSLTICLNQIQLDFISQVIKSVIAMTHQSENS